MRKELKNAKMFLDSLHVATSRSFYQTVILARISKAAVTKDIILVEQKTIHRPLRL